MSEILRNWLSLRLGIVSDYDPQSFEEITYDGTLLANILYNYSIINDEALNNVKKTSDSDQAYSNLIYLEKYLKFIGIQCSDSMLCKIANKDPSSTMQFFYQLYVALNTRMKVHCLINKKTEAGCFNELKTFEQEYNVCKSNQLANSKDVEETRKILNWHKNKYVDMLDRCKETRKRQMEKMEKMRNKREEQEKKEMSKRLEEKNRFLELHVENEQPEPPTENPNLTLKIQPAKCTLDPFGAEKYVKYLKYKNQKLNRKHQQEKMMHKILLCNILNHLVQKEDEEFKEIITKKLLKQSYYEKQITAKLMCVRHQRNTILENLKHQNKLLNIQKEQEFLNRMFQQRSNVAIQDMRFLENQKRQLELHRRLWEEKQRKQFEIDYGMCMNIMSDLVDLSLKRAEYEQTFNRNVPRNVWREWACLFITSQPIFDVIDDVTELLVEENYDEPLMIEYYRQMCLDEIDFSDYNELQTIWNIEEALDFYQQHFDFIDRGGRILGYVVHRLLKLKYPFPLAKPIPDVPKVDVRAIVIGVNNKEIVSTLENCLAKHHIVVLDPQTLINHCLKAYLDECEVDVDEKLNIESAKGKKGKKGKKKTEKSKKPAESKKGKKKKTKTVQTKTEEIVKEFAEKLVQTPKVFPDEEIVFSPFALLGKHVYETINLGLGINDDLRCEMLIEYLKTLQNLKGYVFINFPETLPQVHTFEKLFTGCELAQELEIYETEDESENETRSDVYKPPEDPYTMIRLSKLLPNPKTVCKEKYIPFLTSFVQMLHSLQPIPGEIFHFYDKFLIASQIEYNKVSYELIQEVVYLITKDQYFAKMIYDELVANSMTKSKEKRQKQRGKSQEKGKKSPKEKKRGKSKGSSIDKGKKKKSDKKSDKKSGKKSDKKSDKKSKKSPETSPPATKIDLISEEIYIEPPRPGEQNWEYVNLPLAVELYKFLATMWQRAEDIYIHDFREIFFSKRVHQNEIVPYVNEIELHFQDYIDRPDNKQKYLDLFQKLYNEVHDSLREDNEFKAELHNNLSELRDKLWYAADEHMKQNETERQRIINDNWFTNNVSSITNLYIKAMQLELNRCYVSLQLLQDYYTSMVLKIPIDLKLEPYSLNNLYSSNSGSKKALSFDKAIATVADVYKDVSGNTMKNPFVTFITSTFDSAVNACRNWKNVTIKVMGDIARKFDKNKKGKISPRKKGQVETAVLDFDILDNTGKLVDEWTVAIEGELLRAMFRLKLILEKAKSDVEEDFCQGKELFVQLYDRIKDRYHEEIEAIDSGCQIIGRAIEACQPIQARLVLEGIDFHIDQNQLFYPDPPFKYKTPKEELSNVEFTISNLTKLEEIFNDLAPIGYMPRKLFIFLLQDMVVQNEEDGYISPLPEYWRLLTISDVPKLVDDLYGEYSEYIDWKDFIIWNLLIPYPTDYELLDVLRQFYLMDPDRTEFVNEQQYNSVHFWYEDDYSDEPDSIRIILIKDLLWKMFSLVNDKINYVSLLFYLCKDVEVVRGFAKALELCLGALVCWDDGVGSKFVEVMMHKKCLEQKHYKEVFTAVDSAVKTVVENALQQIKTVSDILDVHSYKMEVEEQSLVSTITCGSSVEDEEHAGDEMPLLLYFLDFDTLINVMTVAFPWKMEAQFTYEEKSLRERLEEIYNRNRCEDFGGKVLLHRFLNDWEFVSVLNMDSKFLERLPSEIVRKLAQVCICEGKFLY